MRDEEADDRAEEDRELGEEASEPEASRVDRRKALLRLTTLSFLTGGMLKSMASDAHSEIKHKDPPPPPLSCGEPHAPGYAEDTYCQANVDPDSDCGLQSDNPLGGAHQDFDCTAATIGPLLDGQDNDCARGGGSWTTSWSDNDCPLTGTDQDCDVSAGGGNWVDNDCTPPNTEGADQGYCSPGWLDSIYDDNSGTILPPLTP